MISNKRNKCQNDEQGTSNVFDFVDCASMASKSLGRATDKKAISAFAPCRTNRQGMNSGLVKAAVAVMRCCKQISPASCTADFQAEDCTKA